MKKIFVFAIMMMACVCGFAQESAEEVVSTGTELAITADGKKVTMWDFKMDDASGDVSFVISVDKAKAGDLWQWCRMWLAENVKQYNQIKQIEDKQEGMLMVNCTLPLKVCTDRGPTEKPTKWEGQQTWKMTVKCKDERFRVQLSEFMANWDMYIGDAKFGFMHMIRRNNQSYSDNLTMIGKEWLVPEYRKSVAWLVQSLGEYIGKKAGEDDDF